MDTTKKVGVFTLYHQNANYGATLQAYALQKKIKEQGFDACVIDFIPKETSFLRRIFQLFCHPKRLLRAIIRRFMWLIKPNMVTVESEWSRLWKSKMNKWESFCNKYITATSPIPEKNLYANPQLIDGYDILLVGSDQVWNPKICSKAHFLPFDKKGRKKIAYAASISVPELTRGEKRLFEKWIPDFDYITVREKEGKQLLESFLNVNVKIALDPTLLLTSDDWNELSEPIGLQNQTAYRINDTLDNESSNYILFAALGTEPSHRRFAMRMAKRAGMRLKILSTTLDEMRANRDMVGDELMDVSPSQYLYLVKNASIVITDSFHCMAFSINFHRNFFVLKRQSDDDTANMNSRIYSLLSILGLEEQLVDSDDADKVQLQRDLYRGIDEKLNLLRISSEKTLCEMLRD